MSVGRVGHGRERSARASVALRRITLRYMALWHGTRGAFGADVQSWQDHALAHSPALADSKILANCVPQRPTAAIFRRGASMGGHPWQYSRAMRSRAAIRGNFLASCIPEGAPDGKSAPPWQHIAAMHPKRAGFGKICAPCIRKALQIAFREYTARRSCHEGGLFAAQTPRIIHGALILPSRRRRRTARAPATPAPRPHRATADIGSSISGAIRRPSSRAANAPAPCSTEAQRGANGAAAPTAHGTTRPTAFAP